MLMLLRPASWPLHLTLLVWLIGAPIPGLSQTSTGSISGVVTDASGAVVPGATVRIIGAATGELARTLETNPVGRFAAPLLRPGVYNIEVETPGFKKLQRLGVDLRVDDSLLLELSLETGAVSESITVTGETELLEETTHSVGQVVGEKTIQDLPLNGRNYLDLGNLTSGTVPNTRTRDNTFSAYGNRGNQNAFLLDGARNVNYLRGLDNRQRDAMRPSLEAVSEFKVQTSNFSAEYGASAGAVVNVVTKSGTNEVHGSLFEFHRNQNLDARDFFENPAAPQALYIQNQFGGSLGGPLVKNRAWLFGAYQGTRIREGTSSTATVPSPVEKQGNFTTPIFNPFSTRANPNGSGFVRDRFENDQVPAALIDPVGRSLVNRYPDPIFNTASNNFIQSQNSSDDDDNITARGDVRVTDRDSLFARYSFTQPDFLAFPALPEPAQTPVVRSNDARSFGIGYTSLFGSSIVNELRFAWNKVAVDQDALLSRDEVVAGSLAPDIESSIPTFSVTGFAQLGGQPGGFGNNPLVKSSSVHNFSDNLSMVRGSHNVKMGFDYQRIRAITFAALSGRGSYNFNGVFSQDTQSRPGTGEGLADLLLGLPHSLTTGTTSRAEEIANNYYWFVQDDWKVSNRLTLNLGLRYELTRPFREKNNRLGAFITERESELFGQMILAGDSRRPPSLLDTDTNNWAPRVGFAYRGGGGVVVRGGYGIFYGQDEGSGVNRRLTNNPPFFGFGGLNEVSDQTLPSSTLKLSDGLPPRPAPVGPEDFVFDPNATSALNSWPFTFTVPLIHQWNLNIQKELPSSLLWEIAYVGNDGNSLWAERPGNQPQPGPGAVNNRRPLALEGITRARVFRVDSWATSSYHGVSTRLEKRFSGGFSFLAAYTYGKSLDTSSSLSNCDGCQDGVQDGNNLAAQKGASSFNIPQRFSFSGIWELPFGNGRAFLDNGPIKHIVGGWTVTGIVQLSDGNAFTPSLSFDNPNTGEAARPDRIADGRLDNPTLDRYFDIDAFVTPPPFTFGNSGRNVLGGPGTKMVNFGLFRSFPIPLNEVSRLEFRFEAFNLFNTPHFGNPNASIGNRNAGIISGTAQDNRQLQFALKFLF